MTASKEIVAELNIVGSDKQSRFSRFDGQRTINLYEEFDEEGKKGKALFPVAGRKLVKSLVGAANSRDTYYDSYRNVTDNTYYVYWAASERVFRINTDSFVVTQIGTLTTSVGHVGIASNINGQIIFVDGSKGWLYKNSDNTFTDMSVYDGFPTSPNDVVFQDGFFLVSQGESNFFYRNINPNDGVVWRGSDGKVQREALTTRADNIIALSELNRRVFVFGNSVIETWYNAGSPGFGFRRDNNLLIQYGCDSADSIANDYGYLIWLSSPSNGAPKIMMTDGTRPQRISTSDLERIISKYRSPDDAVGMIYSISGHIFYEISFTAAQATWIYNVDTGRWSEAEDLPGTRRLMQVHQYFGPKATGGKHYIGAYNNGNIYELSDDYYDNDGVPFRKMRVTAPFSEPSGRKITINEIEIFCLPGEAFNYTSQAIIAPGAAKTDFDPVVFLKVSKDGGKTFQVVRKESTGEIGKYRQRAIFRMLGTGRDFVFQIENYNRTPFAIIGASIKYVVQPS